MIDLARELERMVHQFTNDVAIVARQNLLIDIAESFNTIMPPPSPRRITPPPSAVLARPRASTAPSTYAFPTVAPLIEHNFSIGYDGDIRTTRKYMTAAGDAEGTAICDQLLAMKKTAREKCGSLVEGLLYERRGY